MTACYKLLAFRHQRDTASDPNRLRPRIVTTSSYPAAGNVIRCISPLKTPPCRAAPVRCSADRDIRDFLAGRTDGEDLLHALYDHVLDEPVPERLKALLRR